MRRIVVLLDTPLTTHDGIWRFISRYEALYSLGRHVFDEDIHRFKEVAIQVLRERDPKFDLPPNERYLANMRGKVFRHSHALRKGLAETLALLGNHGRALTSSATRTSEHAATHAAHEILKDTDWVLWASLDDVLPLLAEAAPSEFLEALERDLRNSPSIFKDLFLQEGGGFFGGSCMCGLLWALEAVAWDSDYFLRSFAIFGELASMDPGGRIVNRPANSMTSILLPWLPQTCAPLVKRRAAVEKLLNDYPQVGWNLLLSLLPQRFGVSSGTQRPTWRETIPQEWSNRVTPQERCEQIHTYADIVVNEAEKDFPKLVELVERLDCLPHDTIEIILQHLESAAVRSLTDEKRVRIWNELNDLIAKHKRCAGVEWTLPRTTIERIDSIAQELRPVSPIYRYQRIFSQHDRDLFDERENSEEQMERFELQRQEAIRELIQDGGLGRVLEFSRLVESPWRVGSSLGVVGNEVTDPSILPSLLDSQDKPLSQLAGGYIWRRYKEQGLPWVDGVGMGNWSPPAIGQFFAFLPFEAPIWERVSNLLRGNESHYWLEASVNPFGGKGNLTWAIDRLTEHGRVAEAIECLWASKTDHATIDWEQAVRVLDALYSSPTVIRLADNHAIVEVIKAIQDDEMVEKDELARIEWRFLPLLQRDRNAYPKLLEGNLARDPNFFSWVIQAVFRPENEKISSRELSKEERISKNVCELLDNWQTPPGTQEDGTFSSEALKVWLTEAKRLCNESGDLKAAMRRIGQVLVHSPEDPNGLWIHKAVADVLDAKDAEEMRKGYIIGRFNARSSYWETAGREEREIASKYKDEAEALENVGYVYLPSSLRRLAERYEHESEREELSDHMND